MPVAELPGLPPLRQGDAVVLLHQGGGSSIDHFLRAPLAAMATRIEEIDSARSPTAEDLARLLQAQLVVVVRYLPRAWIGVLVRVARAGARLAYLMDDDLLDPAVQAELPATYRRRLRERITGQRRRIPTLFPRIWVTSAYLEQKYAALGAVRLPLCPHPDLLLEQPRLQLAYLGTSVHQREFAWLRPLLALVLARYPQAHVDLFGDLSINRQFRDLPRTRILHPMSWSNYLADTGCGRLDLLLTPLLPSPFNAARAEVKVIDAARSGAAGLYSDRPPYRGFIRDGIDGLLLPDDQHQWLAAIGRLIDDPSLRARLAAEGRRRALELCRPGPAQPPAPGGE
jgi:glycosyltransferase involved in cell wall biosynthesis